jgi:hypothetical protein
MNPSQGMNIGNLMSEVNKLKSQGGDPNQMIQNLLNSGKVTQQQYDSAKARADQIMQMLTPNGRR